MTYGKSHIQQTEAVESEATLIEMSIHVPRDPSDYRVTNHFKNRLRQRVDAAFRETLPSTLIKSGSVRELKQGDGYRTIVFTTTSGGRKAKPWSLVAALNPKAFTNDDVDHRAITIFQGIPSEVMSDE